MREVHLTGKSKWQRALPPTQLHSSQLPKFRQKCCALHSSQSEDLTAYGGLIAAANVPTLFVLEGGYAVSEIGVNVVNLRSGFEAAGA